jgi:uncharacterized protein YggU (UPF0235/DUF167 family)
LKRLLWKSYEDATVILAIEKALRPSKSTDFALELKQIQIADDKEFSLMQNYTCFFENFSYKVAEAEDANRTIKPNAVKSTFKAAVSGHEILKLWLEEVPWRGLNKANARLLRKLREARSWEQLQRKGITSAAKRQRMNDGDSTEARPRQDGKKTFRGTRAGKSFALKKRTVKFSAGRKARSNYGSSNGSDGKRSFSKFKESNRGGDSKCKHPGLDQRGDSWHDNKDLFECFNSPCQSITARPRRVHRQMQPFLRLQLRLQAEEPRPNIRRQQHDYRRQTRFFDSSNTGKQHLQAACDRLPVIV